MIKMGVYEIKNTINHKRYIGSSKKLKERKIRHFSDLRNNRHPNKYLQSDWNVYGELNFVFHILEPIEDKDMLLIREGYWLNKFKSDNRDYGYNIHGFDEHGNPTLPDELIEQIVKNTNYLMGSEHPNAKLTEGEVIEITKRIDNGELAFDLSREYEIDIGTIYKIANNEVWKSVKRKTAKKHHHDKKLTEKDVVDIKLAMQNNTSTRELANKYNVHLDTIYAIKQGINWSHVLPDINLSESNTRLAPKRKKLHRNQVVQIKISLEQGKPIKEIANEFNVSTNAIYDIKNGKSWADVVI